MKIIATHDGVFHADDVFAVGLLTLLHSDAQVLRTRDPENLKQADFRVDVGGKHDPATGDFDHHQRGGAGIRAVGGVPYAAFGLVWQAYGIDYVRRVLAAESQLSVPLDQLSPVELVMDLDPMLAEGLDAADTGQLEFAARLIAPPQNPVPVLTLSGLISLFNPVALLDDEEVSADEAFHRAVTLAQTVIRATTRTAIAMACGRRIIARCAADRQPILQLDPFCQWQREVLTKYPHVEVVVYPTREGTWMAQGAPVAAGSFVPKVRLPEVLWGLRDQALIAATGVEDAVFVHPNGFLAGAKSRAGAVTLARIARQEIPLPAGASA